MAQFYYYKTNIQSMHLINIIDKETKLKKFHHHHRTCIHINFSLLIHLMENETVFIVIWWKYFKYFSGP